MLSGRRLALTFQIFGAAKAKIGFAFVEQALGVPLISVHAIALPIWSKVTAHIRTFVPIDAQPTQVFENLRLETSFASLHIGVLDSEHVDTFLLPREQPVV